jgi:hypothetical protein
MVKINNNAHCLFLAIRVFIIIIFIVDEQNNRNQYTKVCHREVTQVAFQEPWRNY